ncbi:MAG TPA: glycosyltransferase [Archaeoglobaceae archaeon]|nr:glycosyltransferase [Archaeoglobaceae archaeon]
MSEITLNLLTWNSEETLVSCLESIAPVVDHIVVNDRFSTDSTIEILERYHAEIYQREFSGSFSEERNFLIGKTKTKWIFILDSDEIISREIQENLRKHVADLEKKGFISGRYPRKNYLDGELFNVEIPGHHRLFLKEKGKVRGESPRTIDLFWKIS